MIPEVEYRSASGGSAARVTRRGLYRLCSGENGTIGLSETRPEDPMVVVKVAPIPW